MSLNSPRKKICSECGGDFVAYNVRTHRCDNCKATTPSPPRVFNRVCCECHKEFKTRNIYTVACSVKCGKEAAKSGKAKIAKGILKKDAQDRLLQSRKDKEDRNKRYKEKLWTKERMLESCKDAWGDEYEVVISDVGSSANITIICNQHGEKTVPFRGGAYQRTPCNECRVNHNRISHTDFISSCRERFGDRYTYLSQYDGTDSTIQYLCPDHGEVNMVAKMHLKSPTGCTLCSIAEQDHAQNPYGGINETTISRNPDELIDFYLLKLIEDSGVIYKVGLSRNIKGRLRGIRPHFNSVEVLYTTSGRIQDMYNLEQDILNNFERASPLIKFGGYTECIKENPMNFIQSITPKGDA